MNTIRVLLGIFLFSLAVLPAVHASGYDIEVSVDPYVAKPNQVVTATAFITNNFDSAKNVKFYVRNSQRKDYWVTLYDSGDNIQRRETKEVTFFIEPSQDALQQTYTFQFYAETIGKPSEQYSTAFDIFVQQNTQLNLLEVKTKDAYSPGEPLEIQVDVKNTGTKKSENSSVLVTVEGKTSSNQTTDIPPIGVDRSFVVKQKHVHNPYDAIGEYTITATLLNVFGDSVQKLTKKITIEGRPILSETEDANSNLFKRTHSITADNQGNTEGTASISRTLLGPSFVFDFDRQPLTKEGSTYTWECSLSPAEDCTITYSINYWMYIVLIFAIGAILYLVKYRLDLPHIKKKGYRGNAGIHKVHLTVKNRSERIQKDVQVRDKIPAVFEAYGFSIKPKKLRREQGYVEYVWHLGDLSPKHERIIHYSIKPKLQVRGDIHLPPAKISAEDSKGKRVSVGTAKVALE